MTERAMMALYDPRHRISLPGGYWISKDDDNRWQVGKDEMYLAFCLESNVPVGRGGSMDHEITQFAEAMNGTPPTT